MNSVLFEFVRVEQSSKQVLSKLWRTLVALSPLVFHPWGPLCLPLGVAERHCSASFWPTSTTELSWAWSESLPEYVGLLDRESWSTEHGKGPCCNFSQSVTVNSTREGVCPHDLSLEGSSCQCRAGYILCAGETHPQTSLCAFLRTVWPSVTWI